MFRLNFVVVLVLVGAFGIFVSSYPAFTTKHIINPNTLEMEGIRRDASTPGLPSLPAVPSLPTLPAAGSIPTLPAAPSLPSAPGLPLTPPLGIITQPGMVGLLPIVGNVLGG